MLQARGRLWEGNGLICPFYSLQGRSIAARRGVNWSVGVIDGEQEREGGELSVTTVPSKGLQAHLGVCAFSCNCPHNRRSARYAGKRKTAADLFRSLLHFTTVANCGSRLTFMIIITPGYSSPASKRCN